MRQASATLILFLGIGLQVYGNEDGFFGPYVSKTLLTDVQGIATYRTLHEALLAASSNPSAGGVVFSSFTGNYSVREGSVLQESNQNETAWIKNQVTLPVPGMSVLLIGAQSGRYCTAVIDKVVCDASTPGPLHWYQVLDAGGGRVYLRAARNKTFCFENATGHLRCGRPGPDNSTDVFRAEVHGLGVVRLLGPRGRWCGDRGAAGVVCDAGSQDGFVVGCVAGCPVQNPAGGMTVAIRPGTRDRLCKDNGDRITCDSTGVLADAPFKALPDFRYTLALRGKRFGGICADEASSVRCDRAAVEGSRETFSAQVIGNRVAFKGGRKGLWCSSTGPSLNLVCQDPELSFAALFQVEVLALPEAALLAPSSASNSSNASGGGPLKVFSGLCTIDNTTGCVRSPGWPRSYTSGQDCNIDITKPTVLSATYFRTELKYGIGWLSFLDPRGEVLRTFQGDSGPKSFPTVAGRLQWLAGANAVTNTPFAPVFGWEVCPVVPFRVEGDSAGCQYDGGLCIFSPNFPGRYGTNQACTFRFTNALLTLVTVSFDTEMEHDYLEINGVKYSGSRGPTGLTGPLNITWSSDASVAGGGWQVCAWHDASRLGLGVSGPCTVDSTGCLLSPNYPNKYSLGEVCTVLLDVPGVFSATNFSTERLYDVLSLDGVKFVGSEGPKAQPAASNITWRSDMSIVDSGWRLCPVKEVTAARMTGNLTLFISGSPSTFIADSGAKGGVEGGLASALELPRLFVSVALSLPRRLAARGLASPQTSNFTVSFVVSLPFSTDILRLQSRVRTKLQSFFRSPSTLTPFIQAGLNASIEGMAPVAQVVAVGLATELKHTTATTTSTPRPRTSLPDTCQPDLTTSFLKGFAGPARLSVNILGATNTTDLDEAIQVATTNSAATALVYRRTEGMNSASVCYSQEITSVLTCWWPTWIKGKALLYRDCAYVYNSFVSAVGPGEWDVDGDLSAIMVPVGFTAILFDNADGTGNSVTITGGISCLNDIDFGNRAVKLILTEASNGIIYPSPSSSPPTATTELSTGAIVGIALGSIFGCFFLSLCVVVVYLYGKQGPRVATAGGAPTIFGGTVTAEPDPVAADADFKAAVALAQAASEEPVLAGKAKVTRVRDFEALQALQGLLETRGDWLGHGRDVRDPGFYNRLALAAAWKLDHVSDRKMYEVSREELLFFRDAEKNRIPQVQVRTSGRAEKLFGKLDESLNEVVLFHGTRPTNLLQIISNGLDEKFSGGSFGEGTYLAEDPGKCDQYCSEDDHKLFGSKLHQVLYPGDTEHPGDVFYLFVCRALLGYTAHTKTGYAQLDGSPLFVSAERRELTAIPGIDPPEPFHALVAELGHSIARYREFIVFHSARVYSDYLIAYRRRR